MEIKHVVFLLIISVTSLYEDPEFFKKRNAEPCTDAYACGTPVIDTATVTSNGYDANAVLIPEEKGK